MRAVVGVGLIVLALLLSLDIDSVGQKDPVQECFAAFPVLYAQQCEAYVAKAQAGEITNSNDEGEFFLKAVTDSFNAAFAPLTDADHEAYKDGGWTLEKSIARRTREAQSARSMW